ncbi:hypothetical protein [Anaeromicropila populeti]|uniref:Uncharacterized protein n=1 Tax=Anaeromicropila populeti TaxID=37658 RepID=A0A1I6KLV2_9FIRM|nr:hypothetical protein [Anaeromicropila populeti]SFR92169.1 hypothetical protein SAMN05661086_02522 [Anaeromicropila populeti]
MPVITAATAATLNTAAKAGKVSQSVMSVVPALAISATQVYVAKKNRQLQEKLASEQQEFTLSMEKNRQDFQLEMHMRNAELQESLVLRNHMLRLEEVKYNFQIFCEQAEYRALIEKWPLVNPPQVVRAAQMLQDNTIMLRVLFSHTADPLFNNIVFPTVEQGIRDFIDIYANDFDSQNVIFYHEAYKSNFHGGAMEENIKFMLNEIPVLIVDANILPREIRVSFTIWGFGASSLKSKHQSVFSIPYERKLLNGVPDADYYDNITFKLLAYIKFIIGYSYDAYNLIQYDKAPLFPAVAQRELEFKENYQYPVMGIPELADAFRATYCEMAKTVWNSEKLCDTKRYTTHKTQLEFTKSVLLHMSDDETLALLDESLTAWVSLRSKDSVDKFLQSMIDDSGLIVKYFSSDDKDYWGELSSTYLATSKKQHCYKNLVLKLQNILDTYADDIPQTMIRPNTHTVLDRKSEHRYIEL